MPLWRMSKSVCPWVNTICGVTAAEEVNLSCLQGQLSVTVLKPLLQTIFFSFFCFFCFTYSFPYYIYLCRYLFYIKGVHLHMSRNKGLCAFNSDLSSRGGCRCTYSGADVRVCARFETRDVIINCYRTESTIVVFTCVHWWLYCFIHLLIYFFIYFYHRPDCTLAASKSL